MKKLTDKVTFRHGATINNRIVQAPMLTSSGVDEKVSQATLDYYNARSQSAGMVIVEYTSVSPNGGPSRSISRQMEQLAIYNDSFKPGLTKVAEALKKDGNKAILQLVHSGREAKFRHILGGQVEVPTDMDFPWIDYPLHELTSDEVWQIVKDFGAATKRAIDCGFDGVEIHGANHYLIQEFFSKYSNHRTDYWGGSLEKRMNFAKEVSKEVFQVVKEYAPKDFIVGYRISPEEIHGENIGYTWHESQQLVDALTKDFDFDYIHLSQLSGLDYKQKPQLGDSDKTLAELLGEKINGDALEIVAGGIRTEEQMKDALNYMDLVGIARATLMDNQIGKKIEEGKGDQINQAFTKESLANLHLTPGLIVGMTNVPKDMQLPGTDVLIKPAEEVLKNTKHIEMGYAETHK